MAYRKFTDVLKAERTASESVASRTALAGLATLAGTQADACDSSPNTTLAGLATLAGGKADAHVRAYAKQQQRYLFDIYTVFDKQEHISPLTHGQLDCDVCAPAAAKVAKAAKVDDTLQSWFDGYRSLPVAPPATDISPLRWRRIVDAADSFLDRWAAIAIACGWSTLDVFGCDPDRPNARFDCMGLVLLLDRCRIVGIDEHGADLMTDTGAKQRFRRRPLPPGTVLLWELVGSTR